MTQLTHLNDAGSAHMVDVSHKSDTNRLATATATVHMTAETLGLILSGDAPKGDVFATARLAGIMAAKKTSDLIPLCHPLPITKVTVDLVPDTQKNCVVITATVKTRGQTGVEMEALTAASVASLTLYDMLKAAQKSIEITDIRLLEKQGGKSGHWTAPDGAQS